LKLLLTTALLQLCLLAPSMSADTVYTYTGQNFDTFTNSPPYNSSDHLAIQLQLSTPLLPNLNQADVSGEIVSWTLSAGRDTYGSGNGGTYRTASFTTDASGNIVDWNTLFVGLGTFGFTSSGTTGDQAFDYVAHGNSWNASTASIGTWTNEESASPTPEPASTFLLLLGFGLILARKGRWCSEQIQHFGNKLRSY
jgi:hypothetical protein